MAGVLYKMVYMNIWIFFRVSFQEDFELEHRVPGTYSCILRSHHNMLKFENFSSRDYETWRHYLDKIKQLCSLLLSLLSQSLLVSFLCISRAHTMHPEHQSIKKSQSFCPYTKHLSEDARSSQHADLLDFCQSSSLWYFLFYFCFSWLVEGSSRSPCPTSPSLCFQPPIRGFCRAYFRRYYFDSKSGKCKMFIYGGCSGNRNNFRDKKSCDQTCAGKTNCNSIGHL